MAALENANVIVSKSPADMGVLLKKVSYSNGYDGCILPTFPMLMILLSLGYDRGWSCLDRYMNRRASFQEYTKIYELFTVFYIFLLLLLLLLLLLAIDGVCGLKSFTLYM
jgi:hypothetical protein